MSHNNTPTSSRGQRRRNTSDTRWSSRNQVSHVSGNNRRYSTPRITSNTSTDVSEITSSLRSLNLERPTSTQWPLGQASQVPSRTIPSAVPIAPRPTRIAISEKDIEDYVQRVIDSITPSQRELAAKREMSTHLETIVRRVLPRAKLSVMGGVANTFALRNSDVDICFVDTEFSLVDFDVWNLNKLTDEFRRAGKHVNFIKFLTSFRIPARASFAYVHPVDQTQRRLVRVVKFYTGGHKLEQLDWYLQNGPLECI